MGYLTTLELKKMNFKHIGENVKISDKVSIYNAENIYLDDNCRIDDFCILSAGNGGIHVGKYVHIAAYSSLIGAEEIYLDDFSGLSSRVSIYSSSDDYSGNYLTNPNIPSQYRRVENKPVHIGKHAIIGAGTVILPGAALKEGVAIGALSLVSDMVYDGFNIYGGVPAKKIKTRDNTLLKLEQELNDALTKNEIS
jgi:galactoside O-acetyltransferase